MTRITVRKRVTGLSPSDVTLGITTVMPTDSVVGQTAVASHMTPSWHKTVSMGSLRSKSALAGRPSGHEVPGAKLAADVLRSSTDVGTQYTSRGKALLHPAVRA